MQFIPIVLGDARVLAPGRWRWLRALLWLVALLAAVLGAIALGVLLQSRAIGGSGSTTPWLLSSVLGYLAYAAAVRFGEDRRPVEVAPRAIPVELALGLLVGAGMFTLVFTILRLLGVYTLAPADWSDWGHDLLFWTDVGLREELIARLVIFRLLMRAAGLWPALAISALIFGALHLANENSSVVAALAIAIEAGLMLAAFYLLTGRIWMAVGVHIAWNCTQGSIFGARVSGMTERGSLFTSGPVAGSPDWLTGGPFGPEASLPAVIVGLGIFLVALRGWQARAAVGRADLPDAALS